jgi:UDP-N-acetylglucosamine--N-acetylmuramyl-(pentapeptide) pyrophosphoryl-undecaprenol N-acetylglucosamine transferase
MEMQKVPQAGYKLKDFGFRLQRRLTFDNALFPVKFAFKFMEIRTIIKQFKPDVVIGTGGFASGPVTNSSNCRIPQ